MAAESNEVTESRPSEFYQLDRRLTILETRFDTILPTLATKADLAELKAELKAEMAEMKAELKGDFNGGVAGLARWVATMFVTMVFGFAGMIAAMLTLLRP